MNYRWPWLLLMPAVLGACMTQPVNDPNSPIALLERRVSDNERKLNNSADVGLLEQVQRLEAEVRDLRGEVEQQRYELDRAEKRQRDLYRDLDRRVGSGSSGSNAPTPTYGGSSSSGDPATVIAPAGERESYRAAFDQLKNGQYPGAISGFKSYLQNYPSGEYAANAQYWLGESYYVTKDWGAARNEFQKVLDKHPGSQKSPDAQLKLGYVYYELGRWDSARQILRQVTQNHAGTTVATLAQQRLDRMRQEGR